MPDAPQTTSPDSVRRNAAINELLTEYAASEHQDLMAEMMVTVCRLAKDGAGRGEMKILNSTLKELRYAFKIFAPYENTHKVTIFGSSRTPTEHPEYQQAREFAEQMERRGWMVITGAGDGIMRAGHHGAKRESSFGVAISLPFEQKTNDIIHNDPKCVNFKYFFTRKLLFVKEAEAVVLFPGGFGTQDEGFETLTLVQTGKADLVPIVLVDAPGGNYWSRWREYVDEKLLDTGMISAEDVNLFKVTDSIEEAVHEVTHFYTGYHSARMVRDSMVIRLQGTPPAGLVERLNDEFTDIVSSGGIQLLDGPLSGETEALDLPRIELKFDRRSIGRLRMMINAINDAFAA
jgi:hypothetical protein